jgi:oxygen-independent coproporphyrinogen-3 oxidase
MGKKELELYVHIPFCMQKCKYCDFLSFPVDQQAQEEYMQSLLREIIYYGNKMKQYYVTTIYIGGGTPSWLEEDLLVGVLETIYQNFHVLQEAEITIECNPGTVTRKKLDRYMEAGINRLSIGLQSANQEELQLLGRIHTYEQFIKTYEWARDAGFTNINIDLISGLPYQNTEKFAATLQKVIRLRPEHISAYTLMIEKGTPFYDEYKFDQVRQEAGIQTEALPNEDEAYRIYKMTQYMLKEAGYEQYEISNYAKKGYACRHNIGYWKRENYLGLGLGAASLIDNVRYSNIRNLYTYMQETHQISEKPYEAFGDDKQEHGFYGQAWYGSSLHAQADYITRHAQMEEFMFLGLRMTQGVARHDFEKAFAVPVEAIYLEQIESLKENGLLEAKAGQIYLTDKGMDLSNYCMAKFLIGN